MECGNRLPLVFWRKGTTHARNMESAEQRNTGQQGSNEIHTLQAHQMVQDSGDGQELGEGSSKSPRIDP